MTTSIASPVDSTSRPATSRAQRIISIVLILALLITSLVGCSDSSSQDVAQAAAGGMDAADMAVAPADAAPPAVEVSAGESSSPEFASAGANQESGASDDALAAEVVDVAAAPAVGEMLPLSRTTNILVLGSDRRPNTPNWRTDVMMIVALDFETNRAGVISIPRDIFIERIPNHNPNKINVVDYLGEQDEPDGGGPKLLGDIIQEKMGVPIHHFVRFDFAGFVDLVDALGGVEIEIDCPYYDYFQIENVVLNVKPGVQRLTGDEALVYVRSRRRGGDLDRARRQQRFIWAIRNQVLNENILTKLPALYNTLSDSVQTDLGIVQTLRVARFALGLDKEDITGFVIGYPLVRQGFAGSMWVFFADWPAIADEAQHVFERDPFIDTNTLDKCP
jgi:LCP family protein required for cell wall assembly